MTRGFETFYKDGMRNIMRLSFSNIFFAAIALLSCSLFVSCDKVNIPFGNSLQTGDPNLSYFDTYKVSVQTLQIDSFITSGKQTFTIGYNKDTAFGTIHAGSYVQLNLPAKNPLFNQDVSFDSLQIILKPQGSYYGDTTLPFLFKVYQVSEPIQNTPTISDPNASPIFYNPRNFAFNPTPIGQNTVRVYPKRGDSVIIRLADAVGQDMLNKFKTADINVSTQAYFQNYFNGLYIDVDSSATNTLYNFSSFNNSVVVRLYYKLHGAAVVQSHLDFTYTVANQFNHINYNHAGTPLAAFTPFQDRQLINSAQTGNHAYYNSSTGYFVKISFPDILNLKTLYSYVRVVGAQLIIPQSPSMYVYPYKLPTPLYLFQTDDNNAAGSVIYGVDGNAQNGNLFVDNQYGQSTQYTYDVTNFITELLSQNNTSSGLALLLAPTNSLGDLSLERLIINDQTLTKDIQLKLYVLGINPPSTTSSNASNSSSY
jgi:uncharacterized protein DUF4270